MRCFGPVYLDLFFFWLSLYSYPTSLFILFICKTVFLAITPQPKQGCVLLGMLPATFDEALHITFVFYSTPWLCWWDWHGYWSVLKGSERGGGERERFSLSLCMYVCVHLCFCVSDTPTRAHRSQGTAFDKLHLSEQQAHANRCSRREQKDCCWSL